MRTVMACRKCEFSFFTGATFAHCPACGAIFERDSDGEWEFIRFDKKLVEERLTCERVDE